jgi:hypothetical protein
MKLSAGSADMIDQPSISYRNNLFPGAVCTSNVNHFYTVVIHCHYGITLTDHTGRTALSNVLTSGIPAVPGSNPDREIRDDFPAS